MTVDGFSLLGESVELFDFFAVDFGEFPTDFGFGANGFLARDDGLIAGVARLLVFGFTVFFFAGLAFVVPLAFVLLCFASFIFAGFCFLVAVK